MPEAGSPLAASRKKLKRPWWRWFLLLLFRLRLRQRHLHGSLIHRVLGSRLYEPHLWIPHRESAALGVAIGTFFGLLPLVGLQIIFSVAACYAVRANLAAAALATFISNPLTVGGILWSQVKLGQWLAPALASPDLGEYTGATRYFVLYGKPLLVGSLVSAATGVLVTYPLTFWLWNLGADAVRRRREKRAHLDVVQESSAPEPARDK